jgi:hypothetical protein
MTTGGSPGVNVLPSKERRENYRRDVQAQSAFLKPFNHLVMSS